MLFLQTLHLRLSSRNPNSRSNVPCKICVPKAHRTLEPNPWTSNIFPVRQIRPVRQHLCALLKLDVKAKTLPSTHAIHHPYRLSRASPKLSQRDFRGMVQEATEIKR